MSPTYDSENDTPEPQEEGMTGLQKLACLIVFIVIVCGVGLGLLWVYGLI